MISKMVRIEQGRLVIYRIAHAYYFHIWRGEGGNRIFWKVRKNFWFLESEKILENLFFNVQSVRQLFWKWLKNCIWEFVCISCIYGFFLQWRYTIYHTSNKKFLKIFKNFRNLIKFKKNSSPQNFKSQKFPIPAIIWSKMESFHDPPHFPSYSIFLPSDTPQNPPYMLVQIRDLCAVPSDLSRVRYPAQWMECHFASRDVMALVSSCKGPPVWAPFQDRILRRSTLSTPCQRGIIFLIWLQKMANSGTWL